MTVYFIFVFLCCDSSLYFLSKWMQVQTRTVTHIGVILMRIHLFVNVFKVFVVDTPNMCPQKSVDIQTVYFKTNKHWWWRWWWSGHLLLVVTLVDGGDSHASSVCVCVCEVLSVCLTCNTVLQHGCVITYTLSCTLMQINAWKLETLYTDLWIHGLFINCSFILNSKKGPEVKTFPWFIFVCLLTL